VFAVALFRYATGVSTPGFELRDLENPFEAKKGKAGRRTRTWAWVALALIVGMVALAAIFGSKRHRGPEGPGFWYVSYGPQAESMVRDGMPVVYRGHRVGSVFEHWSEDDSVRIGYYVDPSLQVPAATAEPALMPGRGGPYVRLVPAGAQPRSDGSTLRS
jgi:ABC-type transporter Mla subunit MlaD